MLLLSFKIKTEFSERFCWQWGDPAFTSRGLGLKMNFPVSSSFTPFQQWRRFVKDDIKLTGWSVKPISYDLAIYRFYNIHYMTCEKSCSGELYSCDVRSFQPCLLFPNRKLQLEALFVVIQYISLLPSIILLMIITLYSHEEKWH